MKLVHNKESAKQLWPYKKSKPKASQLPKKYPCLMEYEQQDGGLGGDYYILQVINIPPDVQSLFALDYFIKGVEAVKQIASGPI